MAEIKQGWQTIERVKIGDFFKRKPTAKKVFLRLGYNKFCKQYAAKNWDDINDYVHLKKGTLVFTDFEF